ncbi:MAG TPA: transporter [Pyrinomonadaceae bacterium]|nr:transporter [Pyrinomonadaceae bacterium]
MGKNLTLGSIIAAVLVAVFVAIVVHQPAQAQVRGQYPPGTFATNSGVLPEPGVTYLNIFQLYSFNELKGPNGENLPVSADVSVLDDQNIFIWVSKKKILGANYALLADLPITNNSLTSARFGALAGGSGFADSYYQPITLGWHLARADIQAGYGFTAPTGRFNAGAPNNVGSGYWGNDLVAGVTVYLTKNKGTAVSAFQMYEFHGTQKDTDIRPGQTYDIDYSLTQVIPLQKNMKTLLQVGLIGYGQYQTTDRSGPGVIPAVAANTHYKVNALGVTGNIILPERKAIFGFKYFNEFSNSSTVQGYSFQISGGITF